MFRDTQSEATGRLAEAKTAWAPDPPLATAICPATDTGWFRFSSTTAETYRLAARLVEVGVRPNQVYQELYEKDSLARLQLIGRAMARTQTDLGGRLI